MAILKAFRTKKPAAGIKSKNSLTKSILYILFALFFITANVISDIKIELNRWIFPKKSKIIKGFFGGTKKNMQAEALNNKNSKKIKV